MKSCITFIILTIGSIILLVGCKKDDQSNPVSYVDGYTVNLTENKGTTYTGNFFPIVQGYTCNYSGSANIQTTIAITGYPSQQDSTVTPTTGMLKVLALCYIPLSSGAIQLYPIVDETNMQGIITADTSRFFMKDTQAVYVKAIKLSDGSYLEVINPVFIKSKLVVGDSWETAPEIDMTKLLSIESDLSGVQSNLSLNADAKLFVVGKETVTLPIGIRNTVRLEQANDISLSGSITVTSEGTPVTFNLTMNAKLAVVYNMIADTGIVYQNVTGPLNMNLSAQGITMTISMNINECELGLVSLSGNNVTLSKSTVSTKQPLTFNTATEKKLWNVSQAIIKVITKRLSL